MKRATFVCLVLCCLLALTLACLPEAHRGRNWRGDPAMVGDPRNGDVSPPANPGI